MSRLILSKMADFEECDRIASIVDTNQVAAENLVPQGFFLQFWEGALGPF